MTLAAGLLLSGIALWTAAGVDPECADEGWKRQVFAQARLFELHDTEEKFRTGLALELAGCLPGPAGGACRTRAQSRFQSERDNPRSEIDDRYRRLLREFEDRCRSTII